MKNFFNQIYICIRDLSNNTFDPSQEAPAWLSTLPSLSTLWVFHSAANRMQEHETYRVSFCKIKIKIKIEFCVDEFGSILRLIEKGPLIGAVPQQLLGLPQIQQV